ncbi:hypothetical protein [Chryseobacterium sp. EO14]|uniref:hypothetical protein n=1 Tax=Chryseobacterium sp. EO14 TaxID=2950551 RepID=UPI002108BD7F|nr:hypothetical protein [Chryseobacterium sp. EO14]MCQ4139225.1 hypothetical protein [Chryseobacterium sp. EO14]
MNKYQFENKEKSIIRHNLVPEMLIEVIRLERPNDYDSTDINICNDIFDELPIKGWHFVFRVINDEEFEDVEDFSHIRSIIKRAGKWYKAKVVIGEIPLEKYIPKENPQEDEEFKLMKSDLPDWWLVAHKDSGIIIEFREGNFNDTQKISELSEVQPSMMEIAYILRVSGEWLAINHSNLI